MVFFFPFIPVGLKPSRALGWGWQVAWGSPGVVPHFWVRGRGGVPTSSSKATLGFSSAPKMTPLPPRRHLQLLEVGT